MNGLFGLELPTPVNFVIAFVVVLALIGAATWLVRRFGATRLEAAGRNRQPRLAVIDSAAVDGRRKLVIIRRDNVEHLLMIGGPTDVVVETNIVRSGTAVARDTQTVRANGGDTLPRAMPLPDATHWPTQVETPAAAATPAPAARPERVRVDDASQWPQVEPPPPPAAAPPVRLQRSTDALTGLASEIARSAPEPAVQPAVQVRPAPPVRVAASAPKPAPAPAPAPTPAPAPMVQPVAEIDPQAADQNLANMAHQLEAALRRPAGAAEPRPAEPKRVEPTLRPAPKPAAAAAISAAPAAAPQKPPMSSLEQEMASLLGRPGRS